MRGNALGQDRRGRLRLSFDARAGEPGQPLKAPDRSDPIRREAIDVRGARSDTGVRVCFRPHPFVRTDSRADPSAHSRYLRAE